MSDRWSQPMLRLMQGVACVVIIMWGIRTTAHLLVLLLTPLLLAYAFVALPQFLMHRFRFGKAIALLLTVTLLGTLNVVTVILLYDSVIRMNERLPLYHERFMSLFEKIVVFASAHGMNFANVAATNASLSSHILDFARIALPEAGGFVGDGLLISIVAWIFIIEMVDDAGGKRGPLAEKLAYYGGGVQRYIAISAETGLITAVANLIVLIVVGVDFPVLWCVLYFFLHFIPNVGFVLALVPPALLALLMLGWKQALIVAGALVVTQMLTDYGLTPILMRKGVEISFLETIVSLMVWGSLLGPAGTILAIPLTLSLKKFIEQLSAEAEPHESVNGLTEATPQPVQGRALADAV